MVCTNTVVGDGAASNAMFMFVCRDTQTRLQAVRHHLSRLSGVEVCIHNTVICTMNHNCISNNLICLCSSAANHLFKLCHHNFYSLWLTLRELLLRVKKENLLLKIRDNKHLLQTDIPTLICISTLLAWSDVNRPDTSTDTAELPPP